MQTGETQSEDGPRPANPKVCGGSVAHDLNYCSENVQKSGQKCLMSMEQVTFAWKILNQKLSKAWCFLSSGSLGLEHQQGIGWSHHRPACHWPLGCIHSAWIPWPTHRVIQLSPQALWHSSAYFPAFLRFFSLLLFRQVAIMEITVVEIQNKLLTVCILMRFSAACGGAICLRCIMLIQSRCFHLAYMSSCWLLLHNHTQEPASINSIHIYKCQPRGTFNILA